MTALNDLVEALGSGEVEVVDLTAPDPSASTRSFRAVISVSQSGVLRA